MNRLYREPFGDGADGDRWWYRASAAPVFFAVGIGWIGALVASFVITTANAAMRPGEVDHTRSDLDL